MSTAPKPRVAVIGAGVAGISAAYKLREHAEITLFEQDDRLGGHANTIEVEDAGRTLGIDTAFVVMNRPSYPNFSRFLDELGVATKEHAGGFNFFDLDTGLQYGTDEMNLPEEEVAARYPAEFGTIWREARRFHAEGRKDFFRKRTDLPLGEYLDRGGYSEEFRYGYVILLCTAVWSVPAELIWEMPATTVIAFFMAHDEGGLGGQRVDWRTVSGGSISYVRAAIAAIDPKLRLSQPVIGVREEADGVSVATTAGTEQFDYAVLATHGDQARALLTDPNEVQRRTLAAIRYNASLAVLHTDPAAMPGDRSRWESWNYGKVEVDGRTRPYVAYYMNKLHGFESATDYFVTLDYPRELREELVIRELRYEHPVIDLDLRTLQQTIYQVNEGTRIKLCGSYFHSKQLHHDQIGSHEAAFSSGLDAAQNLLRAIGA
ncbi:NAD(P)/FAD-dependent oxidoreductase [Kitasatospora azatica]|uniref:NAD(P)/FAD-dependent oxidoreductase n=1 Tax=Kitasatospora azatica TaxID=58347 RepID=UPI000566AF2E|nr:FAD-dependent oxidoreductase [Kitasatospora azatica]